MDSLFPDRLVQPVRWIVFAVLLACVGFYVTVSIHWPILRDTSVMHYVIYLMDHGMKPYQQITDNNMPGAYLTERWAMEFFGRGDLAWRICDFSLLATITVAMIVIAKPYDWLAGFFGGSMFALLHGSEGPDFAVEREEVLTALLLAGYALLFTSIRRRLPVLMLPFGLFVGIATCIKPTVAPFCVVLLLAAAYLLRKADVAVTAYLLWGVAGMAAAGAIVLRFLLRYDALSAFFFIVRKITPLYVSMNSLGAVDLLRSMMPRNLLLALVIAVALAFASHKWTWERRLVCLGAVFGAVSFIAQRKGSIYQRYPFVAFLLLLLGLEFFTALRRSGWQRIGAVAGIAASLGLSIPHYMLTLRTSEERSTLAFATALTRDLKQLDSRQLQREVQCLDLTFGCFSALYHLDIMQSSGFTGDLLLFAPTPSPAVTFYREAFWRVIEQNPPAVFVLTDEWFQANGGFDKVNTWPQMALYLQSNYTRVASRSFPVPGMKYAPGVGEPPAYRIYIRNGTPLLQEVLARGVDVSPA